MRRFSNAARVCAQYLAEGLVVGICHDAWFMHFLNYHNRAFSFGRSSLWHQFVEAGGTFWCVAAAHSAAICIRNTRIALMCIGCLVSAIAFASGSVLWPDVFGDSKGESWGGVLFWFPLYLKRSLLQYAISLAIILGGACFFHFAVVIAGMLFSSNVPSRFRVASPRHMAINVSKIVRWPCPMWVEELNAIIGKLSYLLVCLVLMFIIFVRMCML